MKILVTGATGTVGGHVARQLSGRGHHVVALVRDTTKTVSERPRAQPPARNERTCT